MEVLYVQSVPALSQEKPSKETDSEISNNNRKVGSDPAMSVALKSYTSKYSSRAMTIIRRGSESEAQAMLDFL